MSKKQDFLRSEQSREMHPERDQVGSPLAAVSEVVQDASHTSQGGKFANDHNKVGQQKVTQKNQGRRTPGSRNDRLALGAGPQNQVSARKGGGGAGRTPRGAG